MSFEPFLDLTLFSFLPAHFPEKDPRQWAEEEGQEETAVHQTIFQPSLRLLRAQTYSCQTPPSYSNLLQQRKNEFSQMGF